MLSLLRSGKKSLPLLARLATASNPSSHAVAIACAPRTVAGLQNTGAPIRWESSYTNTTIWPENEAKVGQPAPTFTAAGVLEARASILLVLRGLSSVVEMHGQFDM